jgi:hypothetical protein
MFYKILPVVFFIPEIWPIINPLIERIMAGGEPGKTGTGNT